MSFKLEFDFLLIQLLFYQNITFLYYNSRKLKLNNSQSGY